MSKCPTCHQEIKNRFPDGVSYHFVVIECDCERTELCVADNKGEDCNAEDTADLSRRKTCEVCHKPLRVSVILTKE